MADETQKESQPQQPAAPEARPQEQPRSAEGVPPAAAAPETQPQSQPRPADAPRPSGPREHRPGGHGPGDGRPRGEGRGDGRGGDGRGPREGGGGGGGREGGKRGRRGFYRKKKVCRFCVDRIDFIDYKKPEQLSTFIQERGKVVPRRITGTCARHQRWLAEAIKRARNIALMPFGGAR